MPVAFSSAAICWETPPGVYPRACATAVMVPRRVSSTRDRSWALVQSI